jgi:hypothetical protein
MKEYRLKNIENDYLCEQMSIKQSLEVIRKEDCLFRFQFKNDEKIHYLVVVIYLNCCMLL